MLDSTDRVSFRSWEVKAVTFRSFVDLIFVGMMQAKGEMASMACYLRGRVYTCSPRVSRTQRRTAKMVMMWLCVCSGDVAAQRVVRPLCGEGQTMVREILGVLCASTYLLGSLNCSQLYTTYPWSHDSASTSIYVLGLTRFGGQCGHVPEWQTLRGHLLVFSTNDSYSRVKGWHNVPLRAHLYSCSA